jgi:hypothetical protein
MNKMNIIRFSIWMIISEYIKYYSSLSKYTNEYINNFKINVHTYKIFNGSVIIILTTK